MGLFDTLTVNSFTTHMDLALKRADNPPMVWRHVASALTAMRKIQAKRIETLIPYEGWKYAVEVSSLLGVFAAGKHAQDALQDIQWISDQAIRWRDEALARETRLAE